MNEMPQPSLDSELARVETKVILLGRAVEQQLVDTGWMIRHPGRSLGQSIEQQRLELHRAAEECEEAAIGVVADHAAETLDLRHMLAVIRIASELKQAGSLSCSVADHLQDMTLARPEDLTGSLLEMIELAQIQLRDACVAFEKRDADLAKRALEHQDAISGLHSILFKEILQGISDQDKVSVELVHLLYVIKSLEKIGDHATEIASSVIALSNDH